jgi:para-aminobenzoate synthetase
VSDVVEEFRRLAAGSDRCFWLDGGGSMPPAGGRSLLGALDEDDLSLTYDRARGEVVAWPSGEVVGEDVFTVLEEQLDGDPDTLWVGFLGYAARPDLPVRPLPGTPDAVWMRCRDVRVVEHEPPAPPPGSRPPVQVEPVPDWYRAAFDRVQEELHAGNTYEVNLTYRETVQVDDPIAAYTRLRAANPAPYAGVLHHGPGGDSWLLSASPERFATVDGDRRVETRPIKGTTPRSTSPEQDALLRARLAAEPKFRAENLMIVDLLRNDLARVCEPGTVTVPSLMQVESYASVHQLVSTVRGRLRAGISTVAALRALFPTGSMTGAPKLRTMQVIDAVEEQPRGVYAGAFGWISGDGRADLGVVIRSVFGSGSGSWWLGTGGGITVRSDVTEEWAESRWKAGGVRTASAPRRSRG